jgi:SGNH hydrolase-like domain, acetyltransferase AlgX
LRAVISRRLVTTLVAAATTVALVPLAAAGADQAPPRSSHDVRTIDRGGALARELPARSARILGHDGVEYDSAPLVVTGRNGDLFFGLDFDLACAYGGELFRKGMDRVAKLAKLIEASGRKALFTVVPNKELVNQHAVDEEHLPQGSCTASGLAEQRRVLDRYDDPRYLPVRRTLAKDHRQTYWKTDLHWTTVGASDWTSELAGALDPKLVKWQRYRTGSQTYLGVLSRMLGSNVPETVPSVLAHPPIRVNTSPHSLYPWNDPAQFAFDYEWSSRPAQRTWPGRTLLLGDSFTLMGLQTLRPLFRHGRYQWIGNVSDQSMADAIAKSDTVVIELVQVFLNTTPIRLTSFRKLVKHTLRQADRL